MICPIIKEKGDRKMLKLLKELKEGFVVSQEEREFFEQNLEVLKDWRNIFLGIVLTVCIAVIYYGVIILADIVNGPSIN